MGIIYTFGPTLTKLFKEGNTSQLSFSACEMQGWRSNMVK
jgi:hypothetical protein